jgi:hypothetical protein
LRTARRAEALRCGLEVGRNSFLCVLHTIMYTSGHLPTVPCTWAGADTLQLMYLNMMAWGKPVIYRAYPKMMASTTSIMRSMSHNFQCSQPLDVLMYLSVEIGPNPRTSTTGRGNPAAQLLTLDPPPCPLQWGTWSSCGWRKRPGDAAGEPAWKSHTTVMRACTHPLWPAGWSSRLSPWASSP